MSKIQEIKELLDNHFTTAAGEEKAYTDRKLLKKIAQLIEEYDEPTKCSEDCGCEAAGPKNNYQMIMNTMNMEILATLGVKLISINNNTLAWITSTGQVFPYENQLAAIQYEMNYLATEIEQ